MDRANENASQALQRSKMSRISDMGARTQARLTMWPRHWDSRKPRCASNATTFRTLWAVPSRWPPWWCSKTRSPRNPNTDASPSEARTAKARWMTCSALHETLTRRFKHGNIAGDSGESIDAEQRVASAAGKMTTAVAAETIAANGNDNGEGGSDISGKGHAVPVGVQNDARETPPTSSSRTQTGITLPTSRTWWSSTAASRRSWPPPRRLRTVA